MSLLQFSRCLRYDYRGSFGLFVMTTGFFAYICDLFECFCEAWVYWDTGGNQVDMHM